MAGGNETQPAIACADGTLEKNGSEGNGRLCETVQRGWRVDAMLPSARQTSRIGRVPHKKGERKKYRAHLSM